MCRIDYIEENVLSFPRLELLSKAALPESGNMCSWGNTQQFKGGPCRAGSLGGGLNVIVSKHALSTCDYAHMMYLSD